MSFGQMHTGTIASVHKGRTGAMGDYIRRKDIVRLLKMGREDVSEMGTIQLRPRQ